MKDFEPGGPELLGRWRLLSVTASRRIEASAEEVWAVIGNHETWTSWHEDYAEHEALTTQVDGVGARFRTKEWILRSESEIVRWEPGRVIGLQVLRSTGLRWLITSYYSELAIEPESSSSCTVRYRSGFRGTVVFWLMSAYTVGQTLGSIYFDSRASLAALERYLDA